MLRYRTELGVAKRNKTICKMLGVIAIFAVAAVCYSVSVYAWFQEEIVNSGNIVRAAEYRIHATVALGDQEVPEGKELEAGKKYTVTLKAEGGTTTGYCVIECGAYRQVTEQIVPGATLSFSFEPPVTGVYAFTGIWGSYQGTAGIVEVEPPAQEEMSTGDEMENLAEESVYEVQSGDTLWEIAQRYDMTVEQLALYNQIEDPDVLQIRQILKIPHA